MSQVTGSYDKELQMFIEKPRDPDISRMNFLRWLVKTRELNDGGLMLTIHGEGKRINSKGIVVEGAIGKPAESREAVQLGSSSIERR